MDSNPPLNNPQDHRWEVAYLTRQPKVPQLSITDSSSLTHLTLVIKVNITCVVVTFP
jgi:hypothetical protein